MRDLKSIVTLLILTAALTACDQAVTNYVQGSDPSNIPPSRTPTSLATGNTSIKRSPGNFTGTSSSVSAKATITTTNRTLSSSSVSAKISISSDRTNY